MICKLVHLKPNTDQNCFSYYSYAGPGEYLISFEDRMGQHFNYVITVTEWVEYLEKNTKKQNRLKKIKQYGMIDRG